MSVKGPPDFAAENERLTRSVVEQLGRGRRHSAVIAEAPPGAGKSTLTASVAKALLDQDRKLKLAVVTQTNEQADDLVVRLVERFPKLRVARVVGDAPSHEIVDLHCDGRIIIGEHSDDAEVRSARVVVGTARKWQYERARLQKAEALDPYPIGLIDEAYQMRSDALFGIADLFEKLFCVGDPGQLDPFTLVDDSLWKGLPYAPSHTALGTLRAYHPDLEPIQLPTSWRLPPSAARIVSSAFYPFSEFDAGTASGERTFELHKVRREKSPLLAQSDPVLERAARTGWAYLELPERLTVRTDHEIAEAAANAITRLLQRGATVVDELRPSGQKLEPGRIAVIAAHNDQVHAVRYALKQAGQNPDDVVISTANKIQGREYDFVFVWHPLAGRRDATAFHLEAGRMCVMLSRHRHACVVLGRAGADKLLAEFPDTDPIYIDEPEKFPDGWQANHDVLEHLAKCRID